MQSRRFTYAPTNLKNILVVLLASLPLFVYAYSAVYTRFMADDFCFAEQTRLTGIIPTITQFYFEWTGGVTTLTIMTATSRFGPLFEYLSVIALLFIWWAAVFGVLRIALMGRQIREVAFYAALGATFILLATMNGSPNVIQSVFWKNGRWAYLIPIVLFSVYIWLVFQSKITGYWRLCLCALVTLIAAATALSYGMLALCLFGAGCILFRKHEVFPSLIAGFTGNLLGFIIVVVAPGNAIRQANFPKPDIGFSIISTLSSMGATTAISLIRSPLFTVAIVVLPFLFSLFADKRPIRVKWYAIGIPIAIFLLDSICFFPSFYGQSQTLPGRVWIIPEFITICGLAIWGYCLGALLKQNRPDLKSPRYIGPLVAVISLLLLGWSLTTAFQTESALAQYAGAWDQRDLYIRSATVSSGSLKAVSFYGQFDLEDLKEDNKFWVNTCIANFYGLNSIVSQ